MYIKWYMWIGANTWSEHELFKWAVDTCDVNKYILCAIFLYIYRFYFKCQTSNKIII